MPATNEFTLILHVAMVSKSNHLDLYEFLLLLIHFNFASKILVTPDVGATNLLAIGLSKSFHTISSSDLHSCLHLRDTIFCKGRKVMEISLKKSCLGALYLADSDAIQSNCWFRIAEAREKFFKLSENTWAVYSIGTINTNKVCPTTNDVTAVQIQSGDTVKVRPRCSIRTMDHLILADELKTIKKPSKLWTGPGNSPTSSGMATKKPSTGQCKDCGQNKTGSLMPPSCWTNWTTCKSRIHNGLSHPQQPWSQPRSAPSP
jgi:hypothetical protein